MPLIIQAGCLTLLPLSPFLMLNCTLGEWGEVSC